MGKDRCNGAGLARRFGFPGGWIQTFDKHLVNAIIGSEDLDCGSAEVSVNLGFTGGHGFLLREYDTSGAIGHSEITQ
jgi:hypothetical protein